MIETNEQLRNRLAQSGKTLTDSQREKIAEQQQTEAQRIRTEFDTNAPLIDDKQTALDRILARVPALIAVIQDTGDTVITVSRSVIISLLPVVLALALYVEAQRVTHGLQLFEASHELAVLGAWLLVIANLLLELIIHWKNQQAAYVPDRKAKRSLRIMWRDVRYFLGLDSQSNDWTEQHHGPAHRYETVLSVVTWTILLLAVAGSMTAVLDGQAGNWLAGFLSIFTESTLLEMVTWGAGLLFALTVVKVSQSLTSYVAARSVEFASELISRADTSQHPDMKAHHEAREQAIQERKEAIEREHLLAMLSKVKTDNVPFGSYRQDTDAHDDTEQTPSVNGHTDSASVTK